MSLLDGLIEHWKLNASGLLVGTHAGKTLTNTNSVTTEAGKLDEAASFASASSQKLDVADDADLSPTAAFSVAGWYRHRTAVGAGRTMCSKGTYSGSWTFAAGSDAGGTGDEFEMFFSTGAGDVGNTLATSTDANAAADTWYDVLWVYDGSLTGNANRLKLFVDGVQKTLSFTGTIPAAAFDSTGPFTIGAWNGLGRYHNGAVDSLSLWGRALASAEATEHFNGGAGLDYAAYGGVQRTWARRGPIWEPSRSLVLARD